MLIVSLPSHDAVSNLCCELKLVATRLRRMIVGLWHLPGNVIWRTHDYDEYDMLHIHALKYRQNPT